MKRLSIIMLLVLSCSAIQENGLRQNNFSNDKETDLNKVFEKTRLGKIFTKMLSLNEKVQQVDFRLLFTSLDELTNSLNERKQSENASLQQDEQQYTLDRDFYQNQVTEYTQDVAQYEVSVTELTQTRTQLEQLLRGKNQELSLTENLSYALKSQTDKNQRIFQKQDAEFNKAILTLDKAIEQMQQVKSSSFIEVDNEDILDTGNTLTQILSEFSAKVIFYEPIIESLLEISQAKFADQELVSKVLKLMQQLRADINDSKNALAIGYETDKQDAAQLLEQYQVKVDTLTNEIIPQLRKDIDEKDSLNCEVTSKASMLKDASQNLQAATANLNTVEARWVERFDYLQSIYLNRLDTNSKLNDEYSKELQILSYAVQVLERNGIQRP